MVLKKTGCDEIMLDCFLSYILMRTRDLYDCSWILENIGSVFFFFIQMILYFWLDNRAVVMLSDFS